MHVGVWRLGESGGDGFVLGCALGWAGWGHPKLHLSINVAFGASDWLVSVCSWAWDSFTIFRVFLVISCSAVRWVEGQWYASGGSHHLEPFPNLFFRQINLKTSLKFSS